MPPKKCSAPAKKVEPKKTVKVVEDKTFGLKNKKGGKQQKFIQQVQKQQTGNATPVDKRKEEKDKKLAEQREMAKVFKPAVPAAQKVEKGTDPKSVVCAFYKKGTCTKGNKCKFSHDLSVEQKTAKRSVYVDMRDHGDDDMSNWDDAKLQEVVDTKHARDKKRPSTDIICKYFLDALEKSKYGWFWECPNGEKCIYRHALPVGYVLKKSKKIEKDGNAPKISMENLIERERAALGPNQTPINLDSFLAWKKRKLLEKESQLAAEAERKKADFARGRQYGISGREVFCFNPELVDDGLTEDGGAVCDSYKRAEEDDGVEFKEIDIASLSLAAREKDEEEHNDTMPSTSPSCLKKQAEAHDEAATDNDDVGPINAELFLTLGDELPELESDDED